MNLHCETPSGDMGDQHYPSGRIVSRWEWWRYRCGRIARKAAASSLVSWLALIATSALIALLPFIDEGLHRPFGKYWPWMGRALGTQEKVWTGLGMLLFVLICIWVFGPNRRDPAP